jgi:hypothetical protein
MKSVFTKLAACVVKEKKSDIQEIEEEETDSTK